MSDLELIDGTMDSREVARVTGKQHAHVCRDIRSMLKAIKVDESRFGSVYLGGNGEQRQCFRLPKLELLTLISGYDTVLRHKVVTRWAELEGAELDRTRAVAPQSFAEALRLAADQQEQLEAQQLQLEHKSVRIEKLEQAVAILAPQAEVAEKFLLNPRFLSGTKLSDLHNTVVAHYAIKTPLFFQTLRDAGVLWSSTKALRPMKPYVVNVDPTKVWFCRPLDVVGDYEVTPAGAVGILCLMRDRGVPATRLTQAEANERIRQGWAIADPCKGVSETVTPSEGGN